MDSRSHNRQALVELIRRGHIPMAARASAIALAGMAIAIFRKTKTPVTCRYYSFLPYGLGLL